MKKCCPLTSTDFSGDANAKEVSAAVYAVVKQPSGTSKGLVKVSPCEKGTNHASIRTGIRPHGNKSGPKRQGNCSCRRRFSKTECRAESNPMDFSEAGILYRPNDCNNILITNSSRKLQSNINKIESLNEYNPITRDVYKQYQKGEM